MKERIRFFVAVLLFLLVASGVVHADPTSGLGGGG
jgi:hypothetical protein